MEKGVKGKKGSQNATHIYHHLILPRVTGPVWFIIFSLFCYSDELSSYENIFNILHITLQDRIKSEPALPGGYLANFSRGLHPSSVIVDLDQERHLTSYPYSVLNILSSLFHQLLLLYNCGCFLHTTYLLGVSVSSLV